MTNALNHGEVRANERLVFNKGATKKSLGISYIQIRTENCYNGVSYFWLHIQDMTSLFGAQLFISEIIPSLSLPHDNKVNISALWNLRRHSTVHSNSVFCQWTDGPGPEQTFSKQELSFFYLIF